MTWTYQTALTLDRDKVRFLCGDTQTADQLVSDEEIAGALSLYGDNVFRAAAAVCRHLAARFSRDADKAIDDMRKSLSQRATAFAKRADELDAQADDAAGSGAVAPPMWYAGGISVADKALRSDDLDRVRPMFSRDDMDFHRPASDES